MTWTTPKTFTAGMVITETDLNTHLRDNLNALKMPPFQQIVTASAGVFATTASTAVPISTANLSVTLNTFGGDVQAVFQGVCPNAGGMFNLDYDGTAWTDRPSGIIYSRQDDRFMFYHVWVTGLPSGTHTFRPTWHGTGQALNLDITGVPAIFWVREG